MQVKNIGRAREVKLRWHESRQRVRTIHRHVQLQANNETRIHESPNITSAMVQRCIIKRL